MAMLTAQDLDTDAILDKAAEALQVSKEDMLKQGIQALLKRRLRTIEARIFDITGRHGVSSVREMEEHYRQGTLEEADSWGDFQRLDHLEHKRDRLLELIEMLP